MASVQADGGIVSTLDDGLTFLEAFFAGRLFPPALLAEMQRDWHRIFYPLEYGTGIMRFQLPRAMTGFRRVPAFIGHSGASGTVMFACPDRGLTVVGTVNQTTQRSMPLNFSRAHCDGMTSVTLLPVPGRECHVVVGFSHPEPATTWHSATAVSNNVTLDLSAA